MTEEQVTKTLMAYLEDNGWNIISYDYPGSGTGRMLHPNYTGGKREKNKGSIIPDIVAARDDIALFFENKDRYYRPDYIKVNKLIVDNQYTNDIGKLLFDCKTKKIFYGIGLPTEKHKRGSQKSANLVNFILGVNVDKTVKILYNPKKIIL